MSAVPDYNITASKLNRNAPFFAGSFGISSSFVRDGAIAALRDWVPCGSRVLGAGAVGHETHEEGTNTMDKRIVITAVSVLLTACAGLPSVDPGMSRQDLEAKGGKRLAAADLRQSITGALVSGRSPSGRAFVDWSLDANGAVNGTISTQHGVFPQTGKWNVSEDGKFCYTVDGPHQAGGSYSGCWDWYRLGADLYAVDGTSAMKREVVRR